MPQPLYQVGDLHIALESVILVTALRVDPMSGDLFFAIRIQGHGDALRIVYARGEEDRAKQERLGLLDAIGVARESAQRRLSKQQA